MLFFNSLSNRYGNTIPLNDAVEMTANYRRENPLAIKAWFFGKDMLNEILDPPNCMGIRMYYTLDNDGNKQLMIVGANAKETDMIELVANFARPCPELCGFSNSLNT